MSNRVQNSISIDFPASTAAAASVARTKSRQIALNSIKNLWIGGHFSQLHVVEINAGSASKTLLPDDLQLI